MGTIRDAVDQFGRLRDELKPEALARRLAPTIEPRVRDIIATKSYPPRKDGTPSTIGADVARTVRVVPTGAGFTVQITHDAAAFLQNGTSRMDARPLITDEELRAVAEEALRQAVNELAAGFRR
jgi:hypothetical protein